MSCRSMPPLLVSTEGGYMPSSLSVKEDGKDSLCSEDKAPFLVARFSHHWMVLLAFVAAVAAALAAPARLDAGGPLLVAADGTPLRWNADAVLRIHPDRGGLGTLANPTDILDHAVRQWNAVETSRLLLSIADPLGSDIENLSELQFDQLITANDGTNPIIFDSSGAIFDAIFGPDSGVLGIAGPSLINPATNTILKGYAVFNGDGIDAGDAEVLRATFTHELGHFLNLDHSQINGVHLGAPVPGFTNRGTLSRITTMFPVLLGRSVVPHPMASLHRDDAAAVSSLYPHASFNAMGRISGRVFDIDGVTPIQGVNVVARNVLDPTEDALSFVSGQLASPDNGFLPENLRGFYELSGLTPGAEYILYIEEVDSNFDNGSSVGPLDPPLDLDVTDRVGLLEFWNGASESTEEPPDDRDDSEAILITTGAEHTDIDFLFNGLIPRLTDVEPSRGLYTTNTGIVISGFNFEEVTRLDLEGPETFVLEDPRRVDLTTITGIVSRLHIPGEYRIIAKNRWGLSEDAITFLITEPPPIVFDVTPLLFTNNVQHTLSVAGEHLLGTQAILLVEDGTVLARLDELTIRENTAGGDTEFIVEAALPIGTFPGVFDVVASNTAGDSAAAPVQIEVRELLPLLSGLIEPTSVDNRGDAEIRLLGENLSGAQTVHIAGEMGTFDLTVVATSFTEVVAVVPGGLPTGSYTVSLTNTSGTVDTDAELTIFRSSGGGSSCGALPIVGSGNRTPTDLLLFLALLFVLRLWGHALRRQRRPYNFS